MLVGEIKQVSALHQKSQSNSLKKSFDEGVIEHLSQILNNYLKDHPNITLNGLSKKCRVSEPTLRRIAKKQIKTLPNVSTVLDLLTLVSKMNDIKKIVALYPGPVATYLQRAYPHLDQQSPEYNQALNDELKNPIKYLIFKLALNRTGVSEDKVRRIFGDLGLIELKSLYDKKWLTQKSDKEYVASIKNFSGSYADFVEQFQWTARFIKTDKVLTSALLNPLFVNGSESVSPEAYQEIIRIQKSALKKISQVISHPDSMGPIPLFFLCALDTLDTLAAHEMGSDLKP